MSKKKTRYINIAGFFALEGSHGLPIILVRSHPSEDCAQLGDQGVSKRSAVWNSDTENQRDTSI
jgi:hypothetical protein